MDLVLNRGARGPAWERWAIMEEQRGDVAFAGEMILTYTDDSVYADVECTILFNRALSDDEIEDVLGAAFSVLSGRCQRPPACAPPMVGSCAPLGMLVSRC